MGLPNIEFNLITLKLMLMDDLLQSELFKKLSDCSQEVSNDEMQHAYENFITKVLALNQTGSDYGIVFRSLNLTRIELQALQTQILCEQGEKCV